MAFGRVYAGNVVQAMGKLVAREQGPRTTVKLKLQPYTGTKVKAFGTLGVTSMVEAAGKIYMGTGVAPKATSGGEREPLAVGDQGLAEKHVAMLEERLNRGDIDVLNPKDVDAVVLEVDREIAGQRSVGNDRPTTAIGSEVALSTTVALLDAQAAYHGLPTALAMRAILLDLQGEEMNVEGLEAPLPKFNILNFGGHSGTLRDDGFPHVWIQETKVAPIGAKTFEEGVQMGVEVLHKIIALAGTDNVGFEAGISPALTRVEDIYTMSLKAIDQAGLKGKMALAADAAASEFSRPVTAGSDRFEYNLYPGEPALDAEGMVGFWVKMVKDYGILSIEDGMHSEDFIGWELLMGALGDKVEIQGDDLFVTDADEMARLARCANSVLIKPNQAGTIYRTLQAIAKARALGYTISPSHRSGKVPGGYGMIPELCLGTGAEWIKPGAPRRERAGFVNNVTNLATELRLLGIPVGYAGPRVAEQFGYKIAS